MPACPGMNGSFEKLWFRPDKRAGDPEFDLVSANEKNWFTRVTSTRGSAPWLRLRNASQRCPSGHLRRMRERREDLESPFER